MTQIRNGVAPIAIWVAMLVLAAIFSSDFKSGYYHHSPYTHTK